MNTVFRTCLLATAATLAPMTLLGACKDKASSDVDAVEALSVKGLSDADIAKHFDVDACTATEAQMQAGLAALEIDTPTDTLTWQSQEIGDEGVEFDGITLTDKDGDTITIAEFDLDCLREVDGVLMVDRVSAENIVIDPEEGKVTIASITVVEPDISELEDLLDGNTGTDLPSAQAFALDDLDLDLTITSERSEFSMSEPTEDNPAGEFTETTVSETVRSQMSLDSIAFASAMSENARDGFVRIGEVDFESDSDIGQDVSVDFEGATVTGLASTDMLSGDIGALSNTALGPFAAPYDTLDVGSYSITADTLSFAGEGMTGQNTMRSDKTDIVSVFQPATLQFSGPPTTDDLMPLYDAIKGMGYDEVTVSGRSNSVYDEATDRMVSTGGFFEWENGFRLVIDSDVTGLKAMRAAARDMTMPATGEHTASTSSDPLADIKVNSLIMRLDDNSIVERVFAAVAEAQGTTPKMLRMQAKGLLAMGSLGGSGLGIDQEVVAESISALGEFLDTPNSSLIIGVEPNRPMGLEELMTASQADTGFAAQVEK